jgi:twitching motility protein PilT
MGGSDLHITTNSAPRVRVHGRLRPLDMPPLTAADTKSLAYSVLTDAQKHRFEENLELDFSFGLKNLARFRGNVFNQRGAVGSVFRTIPWEIKGFDALGLPQVVKGLCDKPRGLVLVTGPTGWRNARPGDDRVGPAHRRNRSPDLCHFAHELSLFHHQPNY